MTTSNTGRGGREAKSVSSSEPYSTHPASSTHETDLFCHTKALDHDPETGELLSQEPEPTLRDELSMMDDEESAIANPLFNLPDHESVRLNHLKNGAVHVGKSLAYSHDLTQALKGAQVFGCADHLRPSEDGYRALKRCKSKVCPYCLSIESSRWVARVRAGMTHLSNTKGYYLRDEPTGYAERFPNGAMIALKITMNAGHTCGLDELRERLDLLHSTFYKLTRKLSRGDDYIGAFRSTEIVERTPSEDGAPSQANPHLHTFILLRGDCDLTHLTHELLRFWPKSLKVGYKGLGKQVSTVSSLQGDWIKRLDADDIDNLSGWVKYITKGSYDLTSSGDKGWVKREAHRVTTSSFWAEVERVTKKIKMVQSYGLLKIAMSEAQAEYKEAKKRAPRGQRESTKLRSGDLIYDHLLKSYVRSDDWSGAPTPHALTQSLSHLQHTPHFSALWVAERERYEEKVRETQLAQMWRVLALQSLDKLPTIIHQKAELILINSRKGQGRSREPDEVVRRSPPEHGSPKSAPWLPYKDD